MVSLLLMKKIAELFLMMFMGTAIVKLGFLKAEDSRILSVVCLYIISPCVTLNAFQVENTPQVQKGLLLNVIAAVVIHAIFLLASRLLEKPIRLDPVEKASAIYSNAANLIIPIVIALFGKEWIIYTCAYGAVQMVLIWTHCRRTLCSDYKVSVRSVLTNVNMISLMLGAVCFLAGIKFPAIVVETMDSMGGIIGPVSMLVTGILIGGMDVKKLVAYRRVIVPVCLRMIVYPLAVLAVMKLTGAESLVENGQTVLMISFLAACAPSASTVTQMAQVYEKDAEYAGVINVTTTLSCILTMPAMIYLYQML